MAADTSAVIRVRFAPSPTGHLHIGSLRTAIFNWLFARHHKGTFLLRIEDTDVERSRQEYTDSILATLAWMGMEADEPAVHQSARLAEHKKIIKQLISDGKAYRCYCTPEELKTRCAVAQGCYLYDGHCRTRTDAPDGPFVVRFALPEGQQQFSFDDQIRGTVTFDRSQFDDFIIARSDGTPTYNFVVVVDDAFMKISHVIRGEDHISNTPRQLLLYQALGYRLPRFAHIPLILSPEGQRLSKRHGAVSAYEYKKMGYLPDALFNYLVRLGWACGDQEIFSRDELVQAFSLDGVGKKGAMFDTDKLDWLNSVYLRELSAQQLLDAVRDAVGDTAFKPLTFWSEQTRMALADLYKDRVKTLQELVQALTLLSKKPVAYDQQAIARHVTTQTPELLRALIERFEALDDFTREAIAQAVKKICSQADAKLGAVAQPVRLALTGGTTSPGIFDLLALLGKQESLERVRAFHSFVKDRAHE